MSGRVQHTPSLKETLANLPDGPGVYLLRDGHGKPLYIGKALSLRKRVSSYFQESAALSPRLSAMISQVRQIDFVLTEGELEAFVLESNLVKEQRPKYNITLRDDKHYPFLRIDPKEPFPRPSVVRRIKGDGALYFGPYVPSSAMWDTLALIHKTFPLRKCQSLRPSSRPCLEHHMGRCLAPCTGQVREEEYAEVLSQVRTLLEGREKGLMRRMQQQMEEAASSLDYERAARLRNQIASLEKALEDQRVISAGREDLDAFGLAVGGGMASVQSFTFREGRLLGRESFLFRGVEDGEKESLLGSFLQQFYSRRLSIPREILLPISIPDEGLLIRWLRERRGRSVSVVVPFRGKRKRILQMAMENAQKALEGALPSAVPGEDEGGRGLQQTLSLEKAPHRIEAYDISNLSGGAAVGSMVVWEGGFWKKEHYRRFKIKTVVGPNDTGMMEEVLRRRLAHRDELPLPDLILLDGGRGQLEAGLQAFREGGIAFLPILALAKAKEEIWLPGREEPLRLPSTSRALHLLQKVRDEAHRFALSYHLLLRRKGGLHSRLDEIPGIGAKRKRALLEHFGNVNRMRRASLEELQAVPGVSASLARILSEHLAIPVPKAGSHRRVPRNPRLPGGSEGRPTRGTHLPADKPPAAGGELP